MALVKNRLLRGLLFAAGIVSLLLGAIGAFLPVLPTVPFILLAAWLFLKSSPRAHAWLYQHRLFGPPLKQWKENKAISRRSKFFAISMIFVSTAVIWARVDIEPLKFTATFILAAVTVFILTRPNS